MLTTSIGPVVHVHEQGFIQGVGTGGYPSKGMRAATIQGQLLFLKFQMWLLFKDRLFKGGYYLGCSFYSNKYGITPKLKIIA